MPKLTKLPQVPTIDDGQRTDGIISQSFRMIDNVTKYVRWKYARTKRAWKTKPKTLTCVD